VESSPAGDTDQPERLQRLHEQCRRLVHNVERVVHGKTTVVEFAVLCLLAEGHLLIEDVPGVAKTSLAKAIAHSLGGTVKRIQFTPDLLPSDITGVRVYSARTEEFEFHAGPVFANVVLGDEINRASPKTQSALLEVMSEHQVTVDGILHRPPRPHFIIATQNPSGYYGTYPLPEGQLDRFLMTLDIGYPSLEHEIAVIDDAAHRRVPESLDPVLSVDEVTGMIDTVRQVRVELRARQYIAAITTTTRGSGFADRLQLGASPRASVALTHASQAHAAFRGRSFVTADDVQAVARPVLKHRLRLRPEAELRDDTVDRVLDDLLDAVEVPRRAVGV
jgi:MoxR-like ATPase